MPDKTLNAMAELVKCVYIYSEADSENVNLTQQVLAGMKFSAMLCSKLSINTPSNLLSTH